MNSDANVKGKAILVEDDNVVPTTPLYNSAPSANQHFENDWCCTKMLLENHNNFTKTGPPVRFMYYEAGSWLDFPTGVVEQLRTGFDQGQPMIEVEIGGTAGRFLFDLYWMVQVDLESSKNRSISWIDVNGKCFFPKTFIDDFGPFDDSDVSPSIDVLKVTEDLSSENLKIGIEIRIGSDPNPNSVERERKREVLESASCSKSGPGLRLPRWSNTKLLVEGEPLYKIVKAHFMSGIGFHEPNVKITAIHQWVCSDPIDKARATVFFKEVERMKLARGGEANLTFGWLGTSIEGVNGILRGGFVASSISGSQAHGVGVYLSPLRPTHMMSALSSEVDDYGEKHVVLCRVVLGRREEIGAGSQQLYPSHRYFDTGVDDLWNPKWYIVWSADMNTRILPECVVSFKHPSRPAAISHLLHQEGKVAKELS